MNKKFLKLALALSVTAGSTLAHAEASRLTCDAIYDKTNQPGLFGVGQTLQIALDVDASRAEDTALPMPGEFNGKVKLSVERVSNYKPGLTDNKGVTIRVEHIVYGLFGIEHSAGSSEAFVDDATLSALPQGAIFAATANSNQGNINWVSLRCFK